MAFNNPKRLIFYETKETKLKVTNTTKDSVCKITNKHTYIQKRNRWKPMKDGGKNRWKIWQKNKWSRKEHSFKIEKEKRNTV